MKVRKDGFSLRGMLLPTVVLLWSAGLCGSLEVDA